MARRGFLGLALALIGAALASTAGGSAQNQTSLFVDVIPDGNGAEEIGGVDFCVEADVGDTIIVDIGVKDVVDLAAWETTLVFDQSILEVVERDAKMLLASEPRSRVTVQSDLEPPTDFYPTGGLFIGAADRTVSAAESGSGVLARITFRAIATGVSEASMPQLDLDGNGTTDKGPRLLGPGGEDDPIADVNGDSYFDADVSNALISVGSDCSSAPPPSNPRPTPGVLSSDGTPTPGPTDGDAPSDDDPDEGDTSSEETDGPANEGGSGSPIPAAGAPTDEQDDEPGDAEPGDIEPGDDEPGQTGQGSSDDGSSSGLPVWAWVLAGIGSVSAIGAAGVFAVRTFGSRMTPG